jgi:hypothetical protein
MEKISHELFRFRSHFRTRSSKQENVNMIDVTTWFGKLTTWESEEIGKLY